LAATLRGVTVVSSAAQRVSVSPFSEAAVREIDSALPKDWSADRVNKVNTAFVDVLGADFLHLTAADLSSAALAAAASDDDFFMTIELGGFTGLLHGLSLPLDQGLDALHTALADPLDDRYNPAWLRGMVNFIDTTGLPAEPDPFGNDLVPSKRLLKSALLLPGSFLSDDQLANALPTGQATGSASAPMPDDAFNVIPEPHFSLGSPVGTVFNSRGALAAYQRGAGLDSYHFIYSASVGEVYGDGDIGVGRWHGGVVFDSTDGRAMNNVSNGVILSADGGESYAVARRATGMPTCGARVLQLVGSTKAVANGVFPDPKSVTGLTADSSIGVQYAGSTAYVGYDLGFRLADNSVFRASTPGGSTAPWASGVASPATELISNSFFAPNPPPPLQGQIPGVATVEMNSMLAGAGARKAALKVTIAGELIAAAFSAPDMPPDSSGCAVAVVGDGSTVVPAPTDGIYMVFADTFTEVGLNFGAAISATFRPSGAILTVGDPATPLLSIPPDTPMFELAGNADAVIGRAKGPFTYRGVSHDQSLPFVASRAPGVFPTTGTRHYEMVASTAAIATSGSGASFFEAVPGQVTSATLDIHFGESPFGTPNPFEGTAHMNIQGNIAGVGFVAGVAPDGTPFDIRYGRDSGLLSGVGAITGANAEFAVIKFTTSIGSAPVQGAVLLQAQ
jgi:hypothetical protein